MKKKSDNNSKKVTIDKKKVLISKKKPSKLLDSYFKKEINPRKPFIELKDISKNKSLLYNLLFLFEIFLYFE